MTSLIPTERVEPQWNGRPVKVYWNLLADFSALTKYILTAASVLSSIHSGENLIACNDYQDDYGTVTGSTVNSACSPTTNPTLVWYIYLAVMIVSILFGIIAIARWEVAPRYSFVILTIFGTIVLLITIMQVAAVVYVKFLQLYFDCTATSGDITYSSVCKNVWADIRSEGAGPPTVIDCTEYCFVKRPPTIVQLSINVVLSLLYLIFLLMQYHINSVRSLTKAKAK